MLQRFFTVILLLSISLCSFAQVWSGTTATAITYRSGNVGIGAGMTNPLEVLHINGNIRGNGTAGALRINTTQGYIDIGPMGSNYANIYTGEDRFLFNKALVSSIGTFSSYSTSNLYLRTGASFDTDGEARMTILNSNGNVGIGTTSPTSKLHVEGGTLKVSAGGYQILIDPNYTFDNNSTGVTTLISSPSPNGITFYDPKEWANADHYIDLTAGAIWSRSAYTSAYSVLGPSVFFFRNSSNNNSISFNGSTGTGTFDGKLTAKEIEVKVNVWSDYVFNNDYTLRNLTEVEQYIQENQHLPDVPSATEVREKGVNLGEMDALLLKKIEELTLYTIEQQKMLEEQARQIRELQEEMGKRE